MHFKAKRGRDCDPFRKVPGGVLQLTQVAQNAGRRAHNPPTRATGADIRPNETHAALRLLRRGNTVCVQLRPERLAVNLF